MADRKVLVKYYPPDFDPEKLAHKARLYRSYESKKYKGATKPMNVRFMFPFTMCCATCNEFIYIGTKFNSRVERLKGEDYLGITIWRFYGHCPHCRADIQFKTDPQNTEYILESGGTRTYDQRKDATLAEESLKGILEEELGDSIRALEHKTHNTANELMTLERLDELRKINKRMLNRETTLDQALEWLKKGGLDTEPTSKESVLENEDYEELQRAVEEMEEERFRQVFSSESTLGTGGDEPSPTRLVAERVEPQDTQTPEPKRRCTVKIIGKVQNDAVEKIKSTPHLLQEDYPSP